jgi:hypothetical protein
MEHLMSAYSGSHSENNQTASKQSDNNKKVKIEDRPIAALREEVIDQLIMNYAHGVISEQAFERRLNIATDSDDHELIAKQVEDLEMKVDQSYVTSKKTGLGINHASKPAVEEESITTIFSGNSRSGRWQVPKKLKLFTLFGGVDIDFTDAEFYHPTVTLDVFCLFGGNDIYVPENVNIVTKAFAIFGGVDNSAPCTADKNAPTVIIEGIVLFGGIDIKIKRTMKERFQAFAENLKQMLR